jgi:hypothetical protein
MEILEAEKDLLADYGNMRLGEDSRFELRFLVRASIVEEKGE